MSVARAMVAVGYEFGGNHDASWGGFCRTLDEAQQECQAISDGPLRWQEDIPGEWEAVDPKPARSSRSVPAKTEP